MLTSRSTAQALLGRSALRCSVRRGFTTSSRRVSPEASASSHGSSDKASGWSGSRVLAVAVGAGALGWGVASLSRQGDASRSLEPVAHQSTESRYATLPEMEEVETF
ncbi:D-lactate ferricytochrome c oxidoreductase [Fusarium solani]